MELGRYTYDAFGRRIGKTVAGSLTGYVYDGEDVVAEVEGGDVLASYVHGPRIDDLISMARDGEIYYYHADSLGSIVHLTNPDGESIASYSYDAFGSLREKIGDIPNPYLFTSREYDTESGLYFYRARYMDADVGRFISKVLSPTLFELKKGGLFSNYLNLFLPHNFISGYFKLPRLSMDYAMLLVFTFKRKMSSFNLRISVSNIVGLSK